MTGDEPGICIHCETGRGPIGERCPQPGCTNRGQRFIPLGWYESAREYAARVHRPLDPNLGRQLDKYLLCGLLGEGGMGSVYLALQMPLFREVAVKVISGLNLNDTAMLRFEREARAVSALDHPNIVRLYDYGVGVLDFPIPFMVLEYVRHGRTLGEALERVRAGGGQVPVAVVREVFRQILHALAAAHKIGIVHRDIKPDNVMVVPVEGNPYLVKVLDFGLAKAVAEVTGADVSRTGQIVGTPYYMAPEQAPARGRPRADARSDLYAVAVMLYEVFTGLRAFDGQTPLEVLLKKTDPEHRPLDHPRAQRLSPRLRALLERGMAVDPARRFGSADEMLEALEEALREAEVAAVEPAAGLPEVPARERPATPPSETRGSLAESGGSMRHDGSAARGPDATPGWAVLAHEEARIQENPPPAREGTAPHPRRSGLRALGWAIALVAAGAAGAGVYWAWPAADEDLAEETSGRSPADVPAIASRDAFAPPVPVPPPPSIVSRGFVVETSPPGAMVLVDGRPLGRSPIRYEFRTGDDSWTSREVEVRAQREGYQEVLARIPLAQAVLDGRVALVLKSAPRPRPARSKTAPRGLDGILGPDVAAPPAPRPSNPEAPEPPAPEPPPSRIEVPML